MNIFIIRNSIVIGAGIILGMLSPILVKAACVQSDYAGTWYTYNLSVDSNSVYSPQVDRCKFKVNSSGDIVASKSSCNSRNSSGAFITDVTGGNIHVGSKCRLSGSINLDASGYAYTSVIEFGRVSKDKNTSSTVGYVPDTGIIFHANAVKK